MYGGTKPIASFGFLELEETGIDRQGKWGIIASLNGSLGDRRSAGKTVGRK